MAFGLKETQTPVSLEILVPIFFNFFFNLIFPILLGLLSFQDADLY